MRFAEEFPHTYGCLKWTAFYAVGFGLAILFPVVMFGFVLGFAAASLLSMWEAGGRTQPPPLSDEGMQ